MVSLAFKWLIPLSIIAYLTYTLTFICPINDSAVNHLPNDLNYHTCLISNTYLKPFYLSSLTPIINGKINPVIDHTIKPKIAKFNENFKIIDNAKLLIRNVDSLNKRYKITDKLSYKLNKLKLNIRIKLLEMKEIVLPYLIKLFNLVKLKFNNYSELSLNYLKIKMNLIYLKFKVNEIDLFNSNGLLKCIFERIKEIYSILLEKSNNMKLQERTDFIKNEFKNLIKFNEFKKKTFGKTDNIVEVVKDILEEPSDDSDYADDEVPITLHITSTITVTSGLSSTTSILDENESRINNELSYWEHKVNKTLQLALNNLNVEMDPIVNGMINQVKPTISEKFQSIQVDNYKNYQKLNLLIKEINKDSEKIEQTNRTVESISRQGVRDLISSSYQLPEVVTNEVKEIIISSHEKILTQYFQVLQDTIDILESFAETTIQEFSNKLSGLIYELESSSSNFNDELNWKSWKKFHQIKEEIFNFRDLIFDQANNYKNNNFETIPNGLETWNNYIKNIEFHINFIIRDNDDYLKLIRAKANVAFQLREGLVKRLEEQKEQNENNNIESDENNAANETEEHKPAAESEYFASEQIDNESNEANDDMPLDKSSNSSSSDSESSSSEDTFSGDEENLTDEDLNN